MKIYRYCSCGGAMRGTITPDTKAQCLLNIWDSIHSGVGHHAVDAEAAAKARRKEERENETTYRERVQPNELR